MRIGVGSQMRSHIRAARALRIEMSTVDAFRYAERTDPDHIETVGGTEKETLPGGIRVFHINGNEVEPVLKHMEAAGSRFADGTNVIVPAWELPTYPQEWVPALRRFDAVWALSHFIRDSLSASGVASTHVGQSVEVSPRSFLSRRYFGIRESAFVLLNFFDLSSYASRKNPDGVIELYHRIRRARPLDDIQLVLKVKAAERAAEEWREILKDKAPDALIVSQVLDEYETLSLIDACDCFVSLHRSEGFGRGSGEAMSLGRLALATGWSGNTDFMDSGNSLLVDYRLIPLQDGDYPHWQGQLWADPDIDHAARLLLDVLDDAERRRALERKGRQAIIARTGDRVVGLRILDALAAFDRPAT